MYNMEKPPLYNPSLNFSYSNYISNSTAHYVKCTLYHGLNVANTKTNFTATAKAIKTRKSQERYSQAMVGPLNGWVSYVGGPICKHLRWMKIHAAIKNWWQGRQNKFGWWKFLQFFCIMSYINSYSSLTMFLQKH